MARLKLLVTGGAGFIGSNFIRYVLREKPNWEVVNLDKLTYAGNLENLKEVEENPRYRFVRGDIADRESINKLFGHFDVVANFAAESHVDRSILDPSPFLETNVKGTQVLLEAARAHGVERFLQISCYDQETRALTKDGFKHYWEISIGDKVLSLNRQTGEIEEREVEKVIVQDYCGEMVHFKSNRIDLMVTLNHAMFFSTPRHPNTILVQTAETLRHRANVYIPRGQWRGIDHPTISIPGLGEFASSDVFYVAGVFIGDGFLATQRQKRPNKTGLPRGEYLKKARDSKGRFCFPGKIGDVEYSTLTCHRIFFDVPRNDKARRRLENALNNLGIQWTAHDGKAGQHIYFSSKAWSKFFAQFGVGFANKHIPAWMLDYDVKYLGCLFDGLMDSDGSYRRGGNLPCFSTSSPRLVADVCELAFKLGLFPRFSKRKKTTAVLKSGRTIQSSTDAYLIYFRKGNIGIHKNVARLKPYVGKIWCLKVKANKNFIVERGGTMTFCGNTDEVYGSVKVGRFTEESPLQPNSPYAASKAAADLLCRAYYKTYGLPVIITRSSNNYGPYQFPEKLIPLMIQNALQGKSLPVYGKGENVRDWLYVADNCRAIALIIERGRIGEIYNIGGGEERRNIDIVELICERLASRLKRPAAALKGLITFIKDRPGHDFRYGLDFKKIQKELGWAPTTSFEEGLEITIDWYLNHQDWVQRVVSGEYQEYYARVYERGWR